MLSVSVTTTETEALPLGASPLGALPLFEDPVQAGFPSPAENHIEQHLDLHRYVVKRPAATFFLRAKGDSMQGAGIFTDDILVVDRSLEPRNNAIIVAIVDGEFTVKRLSLSEGRTYLLPENKAYAPLLIRPGMDFQVWGTVTFVVHQAK